MTHAGRMSIVKSIASRTRQHGATDPRVAELDAGLRVEKITAAIKAAVAVAPPLSPEQRARRAADLSEGLPRKE